MSFWEKNQRILDLIGGVWFSIPDISLTWETWEYKKNLFQKYETFVAKISWLDLKITLSLIYWNKYGSFNHDGQSLWENCFIFLKWCKFKNECF